MLVDPGIVPVDKLKAAGFPTTKSSLCINLETRSAFPTSPLIRRPGRMTVKDTD